MSKKGNATLYGIRFNQTEGSKNAQCQWLFQPLAWLNKDGEWYLVEFFTPRFLVNEFPNLITHFPHRAWKVSKDVIDNPVFRLKPFHKAPQKGTSFLNTPIGVAAYPVLAGISALVFPTTKVASYWVDVLLPFCVMMITFFIFLVLCLKLKVFQKQYYQQLHNDIVDYNELDDALNQIKSNKQEVLIEINKSNAYKIKILILKLFLVLPGIFLSCIVVFFISDVTINLLILNGFLAGGMLSIESFIAGVIPCMGFKGSKGLLGYSFETNVKSIK